MTANAPQFETLIALHLQRHYGLQVLASLLTCVEGAGGFSGATFWRFEDASRRCLALRLWSPDVGIDRVRSIHDAVLSIAERGIHVVPAPLRTLDGDSLCLVGNRVGEVIPWMPGSADFHRQPTDQRLQDALDVLGRIHVALAEYQTPMVHCPAPGISARTARIERLAGGLLNRIVAQSATTPSHPLAGFVPQFADLFSRHRDILQDQLQRAERLAIPVQICLRDIWHDHVLFSGDRVTGIVDFDAMRDDSISVDVARLVQSLIGNDPDKWQVAMIAYERHRPLSDNERELLSTLVAVNPILSMSSWLEWVFVQQRTFANLTAIVHRMAALRAQSTLWRPGYVLRQF